MADECNLERSLPPIREDQGKGQLMPGSIVHQTLYFSSVIAYRHISVFLEIQNRNIEKSKESDPTSLSALISARPMGGTVVTRRN